MATFHVSGSHLYVIIGIRQWQAEILGFLNGLQNHFTFIYAPYDEMPFKNISLYAILNVLGITVLLWIISARSWTSELHYISLLRNTPVKASTPARRPRLARSRVLEARH